MDLKAKPPLIPLVLLLLFSAQVLVARARLRHEVSYEPLVVGERLPLDLEGWDGASVPAQSCAVAFLCTTSCGTCSALAREYSTAPADVPRPHWIVSGSDAELREWATRNGVPSEMVLRASYLRSLLRRPRAPDVWVTPTRVVLRSDLTVQDARPAHTIATETEIAPLCAFGGVAPGDLEEYQKLVVEPALAPLFR